MIAGSSLFFPMIHMKCVVFLSLWPRTVKILISNSPRTRKFSQLFKNTGGKTLPWSRVGHALRPIFVRWLVKIWQVSSCGKFIQHLESCLLWQLKLTEFCVNLQGPRSKFSNGGAKEECVKENFWGGGRGRGMLVDFYSISLNWRRMRITIKLLIFFHIFGDVAIGLWWSIYG